MTGRAKLAALLEPVKRGGAKPYALTDKQAAEIRAAYKKPCPHCGHRTTMQMLADKYGVSRVAVHHIVRGVNHKVSDG